MADTFNVVFTEQAIEQLKQFVRSDRIVILDAVKVQLPHQANIETNNRKLLRENELADWELKIGEFRVFYEIDETERIVRIIAVGYKDHNDLYIGGEKFNL